MPDSVGFAFEFKDGLCLACRDIPVLPLLRIAMNPVRLRCETGFTEVDSSLRSE
jgi:hypothetical protein